MGLVQRLITHAQDREAAADQTRTQLDEEREKHEAAADQAHKQLDAERDKRTDAELTAANVEASLSRAYFLS